MVFDRTKGWDLTIGIKPRPSHHPLATARRHQRPVAQLRAFWREGLIEEIERVDQAFGDSRSRREAALAFKDLFDVIESKARVEAFNFDGGNF
jgi:hypothetical protein